MKDTETYENKLELKGKNPQLIRATVSLMHAYDRMLKVKEIADIIIPLHESTFAKKEVIS